MAKYVRAPKAGRVPYPDKSGRFLTTEEVEGDIWQPLVALGFVVKVGESAVPTPEPVAPVAPVVTKRTDPTPLPALIVEPAPAVETVPPQVQLLTEAPAEGEVEGEAEQVKRRGRPRKVTPGEGQQ